MGRPTLSTWVVSTLHNYGSTMGTVMAVRMRGPMQASYFVAHPAWCPLARGSAA